MFALVAGVLVQQRGDALAVQNRNGHVPHHHGIAIDGGHRCYVFGLEVPKKQTLSLDRKGNAHRVSTL